MFELLKQRLGVGMEAFASPLNTHFDRFASAFVDVDGPFGSCGSFFRCVWIKCVDQMCEFPLQLFFTFGPHTLSRTSPFIRTDLRHSLTHIIPPTPHACPPLPYQDEPQARQL